MTIDINKKYKTEGGREVTLLSVNGLMPEPVVGYIDGKLHTWGKDGSYGLTLTCVMDLVEVKPEPKFKVGDFLLVISTGYYCRVVSAAFQESVDEYAYNVKFGEGKEVIFLQEYQLRKP